MANPEHLAKLNEGVEAWNEAWNQWLKQNPSFTSDLTGANLSKADLSEMLLISAKLIGANLSSAKLIAANLIGADLTWADLSKADLSAANLTLADLDGANLNEASLFDANLKEAKLNGVFLINAWLDGANLGGADLTRANLTDASLSRVNLSGANLSGANLTGADLTRATLVGTNLEGTNLTGCSVYGISAWDVRLEGAIQSNLVITPSDESAIQVDNLEVAQFVYLLLNNKKIRDVIDTVGKRAVLILGRFTAERKPVLDAIREALRHNGYLPILFDFEKPSTRDTQETIITLAGLVRFIIADISDPNSIPQELVSIVPNFPSVPVQPLLQDGYEPWGMYDHIKQFPWVLPLVPYKHKEALLMELKPKVIAPAEAKANEQTRK